MTDDSRDRRDALPPGTALGGYVIEGVLGSGGFGIVYRARHAELGLDVALKEYLPAELAVREGLSVHPRGTRYREAYGEGLRRFREEALRLVQFAGHRGVVGCRDFFRANETACLVMEYVEGEPLTELLAAREAAGRPFGEAELRAVMEPLVEGVRDLHVAGVLHRDIKPGNVLIRRGSELPVLIDFGAAKQGLAEHSRSVAPYTPGYAAPEQVTEGELGPWTDVYGLGATMWRMVASGADGGLKLAEAEKRLYAAGMGGEDPMKPATSVGMGRFSEDLLKVIDRCLALRTDERVRGCGELLELLRGTRGAEEGQAAAEAGNVPESASVPVSAAGQPKRFGRRDLLWGAGLCLALLVALWPEKGVDRLGQTSTQGEDSGLSSRSQQNGRQVEPVRQGEPSGLSPGSAWTNGLGMDFVWVPAGAFVMGSESSTAHRDERPLTRVRISEGFYMGKYEVTQGQWAAVMGSNPSHFASCGSDCPVEDVSWNDVQQFIGVLNASEAGRGYEYGLPSEAEWEYAARAGVSGEGGQWYGLLGATAWCGDGFGGSTHPVGEKKANAWGLHDMLGNVWEWTDSLYGGYPGGEVTDWRGPSAGSLRVRRGGAWNSGAGRCRAAFRFFGNPGYRNDGIGFRLRRTP